MTVGVSIASIPPRRRMLAKAVASVCRQSRDVDQISVFVDHTGIGAPAAKNAALEAISTQWVAFLDDDDELLPYHIERCLDMAAETGADLVYPWFQGINEDLLSTVTDDGEDTAPFGQAFGERQKQHLQTRGNFIPTTVVARTSVVKEVGGFVARGSDDTCDDWGLWMRMLDAGATFVHLPEITWQWNGHAGHTSGRPWRSMAAYTSP